MSDLSTDDSDDRTDWTYRQIGEFVFWFSQAEVALRFVLADALSLESELIDPVTASYDFVKLCEVASVAHRSQCDDPEEIKNLESLIKRSKALNDTRVRIVHGLWSPSPRGPYLRHMSRNSLKVQQHFSDPRALADEVQKCRRLASDLMFFPDGARAAFEKSLSDPGQPPSE
jgi:hypothetical protein